MQELLSVLQVKASYALLAQHCVSPISIGTHHLHPPGVWIEGVPGIGGLYGNKSLAKMNSSYVKQVFPDRFNHETQQFCYSWGLKDLNSRESYEQFLQAARWLCHQQSDGGRRAIIDPSKGQHLTDRETRLLNFVSAVLAYEDLL